MFSLLRQQNWGLKKKSFFFPFGSTVENYEHCFLGGKHSPKIQPTHDVNSWTNWTMTCSRQLLKKLCQPYCPLTTSKTRPSIHLNGLQSCPVILTSCSASKKLEWTWTSYLNYCTVNHFQNHCHFCCTCYGGSMAEWSGCQTWNLEIPNSSPALTTSWICSR